MEQLISQFPKQCSIGHEFWLYTDDSTLFFLDAPGAPCCTKSCTKDGSYSNIFSFSHPGE